jgi:hypothetical protein
MSNQGAPVAVTKIEQENTRLLSTFTIHVKNIGRGKVIRWDALNKCSPYYDVGRLTSKDLNVVQGFKVSIGNKELDCTGDNTFRLNPNGEGIITCRYPLEYTNIQSAYSTPLVMEFWYGYMQSEQQSITIKRII